MTSRREPKRERPGMTWALPSLYRPSARAHLPPTGLGAMVVLPDGSRAPSGGGSRRTFLSCPVWTGQQTPTAACASGGAAPVHWGGGALAPNKLRRVYTGALLATTIISVQRQRLTIARTGVILCPCQFDKSEFSGNL